MINLAVQKAIFQKTAVDLLHSTFLILNIFLLLYENSTFTAYTLKRSDATTMQY